MVVPNLASNEQVATQTGPPAYDYYYRKGMPLRPPPPRLVRSPDWDSGRHKYFESWIDVEPTPVETPLVRLVQDHYWQGDELMDAVVAWFRQVGARHGRALLDQALDDGIDSLEDPPDELVALFSSLDNPPAWFDPRIWEQGRRVWVSSSAAGKIAMLVQDGIGTFVGEEVSTATGATGRFVTDTLRRNVESLKWFHNVTRPGAVDRFSPVFKDIVRVRLMHAQARAGLRRSFGDEHFEHHGNPISISMTMGAGVTFALAPLLTDHTHGRRRSEEDMDAAMHYWSYICHLLGVPDEIIPRNARDGIRIADYMISTAGGPTEWTDVMVDAAVEGMSGVPGIVLRAAASPVLGIVAFYAGEPLARGLVRSTPFRDVPVQPWLTLTSLAVRANVTWCALTDLLPLQQQRMKRRARGGDPVQGVAVKLNTLLARRAGVFQTPYDHHDATPDTPAGCPVR